MHIFELSKLFPQNEAYSLTDQIKRSSGSVCACLAEAYRKKRYPAYFISKITDSDMENSETSIWLDFALACSYISKDAYDDLTARNIEIGRMLNHIINHPERY